MVSIVNNERSVNPSSDLRKTNTELKVSSTPPATEKVQSTAKGEPVALASSGFQREASLSIASSVKKESRTNNTLATADKGLGKIADLLNQAKSVLKGASNSNPSPEQTNEQQAELDAVIDQIDKVAESTEFDNKKLLDGDFKIESSAKQSRGQAAVKQNTTVPSFAANKLGSTQSANTEAQGDAAPTNTDSSTDNNSLRSLASGGANSLSTGNANIATEIVTKAISQVTDTRASLGEIQKNTQDTAVQKLNAKEENFSAKRSQIHATEFASKSANATKGLVLAESGKAALSQANSSAQGVLSLLRE